MRRSVSILVTALAVVVAACGGGSGSGVAATVDGTDITVDQVESMIVAPESGAVPATAFGQNLYNAILETVLLSAAKAEFGYEASAAEIAAKKAELTEQFEAGGQKLEEVLTTAGVPLERFDALAQQHVVNDKLIAHFEEGEDPITDEEAQIALQDQLGVLAEVCARHILVATEAEAESAKQRILGGESFEDVAKDVGTDGTAANGGDLGCTAPAQFVNEFAAAVLEAPEGEVFGPVATEFGYHLILVESRTLPTVDDVRDNAVEARARGAVRDWMATALAKAEVEVNERYGTWVTNPYPQILPPQS
jgi:parvulin-like peptidyl-prolyl isomerase